MVLSEDYKEYLFNRIREAYSLDLCDCCEEETECICACHALCELEYYMDEYIRFEKIVEEQLEDLEAELNVARDASDPFIG